MSARKPRRGDAVSRLAIRWSRAKSTSMEHEEIEVNKAQVIVVGAGMAGITCARRLAQADIDVLVLDKGRGLGGRLATRRTDNDLQFDHGAQYITAKGETFQKVMMYAADAGAAGCWDLGDRRPFVGVPGMSGLVKSLADGLTIHQKVEVSGLTQTQAGWTLTAGDVSYDANVVVMTIPAPQAVTLLGPQHELSDQLAIVSLLPCLTLMAAFDDAQPRPFTYRRDPDDPIAWIAQNSTKPGRGDKTCWVAQAGPAFSTTHLEHNKDAIAEIMLPMLCDRLGTDQAAATYVSAHRWRYAAVDRPLGKPYAVNDGATLFLGGDWCIGPRVEAAWTSGAAIADAILGPR